MVHELIGIQDNKVDLRNIGKASKDHKVVILFSIMWLSALSFPMYEEVCNFNLFLTLSGGCTVF